MIYDKTPQYEHFKHLPLAKEPLKSVYVFQRLLTTLLLVPCWVVYYSVFSKSRPRQSWSIKQIIYVNFTRRIYKVVEVAGVTFGTRDPTSTPDETSLKETRFNWIPSLPERLREGVVVAVNGQVPFNQVGTFIWPQHNIASTTFQNQEYTIGIFMHGGGYCQMSAHENSRTSHIPRKLLKTGRFREIYSVEYRLLQCAPFPAAIIDASTVYFHICTKFPNAKVILIGDSSGGNLALALARWIRDQKRLPPPSGLLLLSPSCDPSHAFPDTPSTYVARPHGDTDYLTDTPEPRALLQRTFLGFKYRPKNINWKDPPREGAGQMAPYLDRFSRTRRNQYHIAGLNYDQERAEMEEENRRLSDIVHSEYVSPASPKVLRRWGHRVELYDGTIDGHDKVLGTEALISGGTTSGPTGLFSSFPKSMIVIGDAERLTTEVSNLSHAMERDGVEVTTRWVKDAVHDVLMIPPGWWDEQIRDAVWKDIEDWIDRI